MKYRIYRAVLVLLVPSLVGIFTVLPLRAQSPVAQGTGGTSLNSVKVDSFFSAKSIDVHQSTHPDLYSEIFQWYRTRYCYGGNSCNGIDCSHFVNMLYEKVYGETLGPSVGAIFDQCRVIKKGLKKAEEGDVLFFKTKRGQLSHVGIYLQNGKFAHASTHNGVIISDIDEPYYKKHFFKLGRVKSNSGRG